MDFKHPLAGEDLHFTGTIVEVRQATEEELSAAYSAGGCGCGSSCGSGDCGDGNCGDKVEGAGCGSGCGCN
jgi:FKBP-type peptidyl-prolyl cis-trans isomerase SlyD